MIGFQRGEIERVFLNSFEEVAANIAIKYVKKNYPDKPFRVFTDSESAARALNKRFGLIATIVTKQYGGYLFINNLRAHTLALSVTRKLARERGIAFSKETPLSFAERFKMWLPDYRRKETKIC